jgi:hypothetical protein
MGAPQCTGGRATASARALCAQASYDFADSANRGVRSFVEESARLRGNDGRAGPAPSVCAAPGSKAKSSKTMFGRMFRAAGSGAVKVKLTARAKKTLKRKRTAKITVRTIFVPAGGKPVASDRRVTLKRQRLKGR